MPYEIIGCAVEGVAAPGFSGGIMFMHGGAGPPQASINSTYEAPRTITVQPNLSAIGLDVLTGDVRSGALTVQLNATAYICGLFARQARARKVDTLLANDATPTQLTLNLLGNIGTVAAGDMLYVNDELILVAALVSGIEWTVERGYAGTPQQGHRAGANMYKAPPFWVGRAVTLYKLTMSATLQAVTDREVIWRGYLTAPPTVGQAVTSVTLRAEDALAALRRATINKAPYRHLPASPLVPYLAADGLATLTGLVPAETGRAFDTSVHRRFALWIDDGACKALLGPDGALLISILDVIARPGRAVSGSTPLVADVPLQGPIYEVALWDRAVDIYIQDELSRGGVAPTIRCEFPYHPLTIAAALLFSDPIESDEDALSFSVMHPSCTLGVGFLANISQWDVLIRKTSHLEVDRCLLFAGGEPFAIFEFITRELLPAYGFALTSNAEGMLRPIQVGLVDIGEFAAAPLVTPISGVWEWSLSSAGALDSINAVLGEMPWAPGLSVEVNAQGLREPTSGSRATRMSRSSEVVTKYPTVNASTAASYGASRLANILAWRYDGLPSVSCLIQADQPWFLGQLVRIAKPIGLVSPILFDLSGVKVDDLWETAPLVGQIVKLRYDLVRNRYEVDLLLTNYSFGRVAKWRAPAARIKSRLGIAQYIIEGTVSDFGESASDALSLTVGDELTLMTSALAFKGGSLSTREVTAIAPSGADQLVTLNADFAGAGAAGDWLYLAYSAAYSNTAVAAGDPYPYVALSAGATLPRPGFTTTPSDEYS